MNEEESVNTFVQIYEFMSSDDTPIDEPIVESFPADNFEHDWTVVVNADPINEHDVVVFPTENTETTVRPTQALIYLGNAHAGIIGAGSGEFYDERFDIGCLSLKDEFMNDFTQTFV